MVHPRRRRQRPVAPLTRQTSLIRGAMLGGLGNSLMPLPHNKFNLWGNHYGSGNGSRQRNRARFASQFAQAAYGHQFARQPHLRSYGRARTPFSQLPGLGSYPGGYAGGFPRRPMSMHAPYRMGSSAYRSPYMAPGYGVRPRPSYGRPAWNTPFRRSPMMRRGYPPPYRRRETYPTQWYNDTTYSDEEEEDYDEPYGESDYEDTQYGSTYGRQRGYATDFDDSDDDDEEFDEEYDDEEGFEYDQYNHYGSDPYSSQYYRNGRGRW